MGARLSASWILVGLTLGFGLSACSAPAEEERRPPGGSPPGGIRITPDVVYGHKAGLALTFDVYRPAVAGGPAVIFVNSGGFVSGQLRQYETTSRDEYRFLSPAELHLEGQSETIPLLAQFSFAPLLDAGFTVFDVRHGGSPWFKLPEMVADVRDAVRFIHDNAAEFGVDPNRMGLWGASAGGYLALKTALTGEEGAAEAVEAPDRASWVRAVAAYYPAGFDLASDAERFPELIANLPALQIEISVLDSLSLRHHISSDDPPCLIIHGTEDFPFITEPSESVCVALARVGVECRRIAIPGTGHEFRGSDGYQPETGERASREVVAWFEEKLAPR